MLCLAHKNNRAIEDWELFHICYLSCNNFVTERSTNFLEFCSIVLTGVLLSLSTNDYNTLNGWFSCDMRVLKQESHRITKQKMFLLNDGNYVKDLLLNSTGSIGRVNFVGLSANAAKKYVGRSEIDKRILWKTFVCSRQGYCSFRGVDETNRKRAPKPETRCGCVAQMRVHIDVSRDWWYTTLFQNEHNHELIPLTLSRMLRSQRRINDEEIQRMNDMRDTEISTT
ncbi:hypothetical protein Ahy_A07g037028 isoform A [Arachis hypogaea]|uniref:FAR1 domain-containing protein n=1 Tax=Arachis hypogaea TaxID=3818 RepID=A0A445CHM8_ARAHY|nr:hypothetical protein Ahy_A07g037028 isoform A [Arachis hypogaea]